MKEPSEVLLSVLKVMFGSLHWKAEYNLENVTEENIYLFNNKLFISIINYSSISQRLLAY